jgi:DNA-binding MarR family transcriptional regulator
VLSLEEKHLIGIMLFLAMNGSCRKIDVYLNVSSNPRIPDKLDRLESMGLINQITDPNVRSIIIALTPKGKKVAERLVELDRMIKGISDESEPEQ